MSEVPSGGFGTYDEKAMIESTLYGLPTYRVSVPNPGPSSQQHAETRAQAAPQVTGVYTAPRTLHVDYDGVITTAGGDYYTIDGLAQFSPGRPVQPKTSVTLDHVPDMRPHGALLLGGQSDTDLDFDPLVARPVPTTTVEVDEPKFESLAWFPSKIFAVNRHGENDHLVIVPAQFLGNQDKGIERRFTELDFAVTYSNSADFTPPAIWEVESTFFAGTAAFKVSADDASGIERMLVTYSTDGRLWHSADLTYRAYTGQWEKSLPGLTEETSYFIQAMDAAGNVTISDNKGRYFAPEKRTIYLPAVLRSFS